MNPTTQACRSAIERITRRREDYEQSINENHGIALGVAERLRDETGEITMAFKQHCDPEDWPEIEEFLNEQRQRLLNLAAANDARSQETVWFIQAVEEVGQMEDVQDYESAIMGRMRQLSRQSMSMASDKKVREIRERLGLANARARNNEVEDLEVVGGNVAGITTEASMKCPLTFMIMEDPVRSQVCGHTYSGAAIQGHIKKDKRCPVPGCGNNNMTVAQLQEDQEMIQRIRRYKKRIEAERQNQNSQLIDDEDEDDDIQSQVAPMREAMMM